MICESLLKEIEAADTATEQLSGRVRLALCQLNEALFSGAMSYRESLEIRTWIKTVRRMMDQHCYKEADTVLRDAEYILTESLSRTPELVG